MNDRDQFAVAALTGLLAKAEYDYDSELFAERAYRLADAMLVKRTEPSKEHDAVVRLQELHRLWNGLGIKAKYGYDSDKLDRIEELLKPYA